MKRPAHCIFCALPVHARCMCRGHYGRFWRTGVADGSPLRGHPERIPISAEEWRAMRRKKLHRLRGAYDCAVGLKARLRLKAEMELLGE
jgi:hypothetical protein